MAGFKAEASWVVMAGLETCSIRWEIIVETVFFFFFFKLGDLSFTENAWQKEEKKDKTFLCVCVYVGNEVTSIDGKGRS